MSVEVSSHNTNEVSCLIALKLIKGIGNAIAFKLFQHFRSAVAIFEASSHHLEAVGLNKSIIQQINQFDFNVVEPVLEWAQKDNCNIIPINSPYYPPLLQQINAPPLILFSLGNPEILTTPQLAVVGSRSPTAQGLHNTNFLCQALAEHGITITSGLALGIDGEAHKTALNSNGYTIAVSGTGLNRVYPAKHRELAHLIAQKGVMISENLPDTPIIQGCFPRRNRIIAGLSLGTLVVEAATKSGSLITARLAMEEGREVFAIPGSIHNVQSKGCHQLIKQGAKLVESIEDIIEDLPSIMKPLLNKSQENTKSVHHEDADFLKLIDYDVTSMDTIISRSHLTVGAVSNKLLKLELDGLIINSAGGYIRQ